MLEYTAQIIVECVKVIGMLGLVAILLFLWLNWAHEKKEKHFDRQSVWTPRVPKTLSQNEIHDIVRKNRQSIRALLTILRNELPDSEAAHALRQIDRWQRERQALTVEKRKTEQR